jgi:DNA-binding PadR family transcriptional regulator
LSIPLIGVIFRRSDDRGGRSRDRDRDRYQDRYRTHACNRNTNMDEPLTALSMAILLSLAKEDQHGYALMSDVEVQLGKRPGTGSLYAALDRLEAEGLIVESPESPGPREDQRRRYWRITRPGRECAHAEAGRMLRVLDIARDASLIGSLRDLRRETR